MVERGGKQKVAKRTPLLAAEPAPKALVGAGLALRSLCDLLFPCKTGCPKIPGQPVFFSLWSIRFIAYSDFALNCSRESLIKSNI